MGKFYRTAVWAAESEGPDPEILDIGAGTGRMSAYLLEKFPQAHLTLVDIAENMLEMARQRFAGREDTRYVVSDYSKGDLGGPYDIACSALSIHHLAPKEKRLLFRRIFAVLKPGGDVRECGPGGWRDPVLPVSVTWSTGTGS